MKQVTKIVGAVALLMLTSMAANASPLYWNFNYTGSGVTASGLLTTDSTLNGGAYLITDISGQRNGESILALAPAGTVNTTGGSLFSDNLLFLNAPYLDTAGVTFQTLSGYYNLCYAGPGCGESGYQDINGQPIIFTPVQLTITAVPEPATLSLLGLGLIGLVALRRKQTA